MPELPKPADYFVDRLKRLAHRVRDAAMAARRAGKTAGVSRQSTSDTIYEIDAEVEPILEKFCEEWSRELPLILIAEGFEEECAFPRGSDPAGAGFRLIVDPIDGTRGLMYDKRSAWVLVGIAPNNGAATSLQDIHVAVQAEIPISKQHLADTLWASRGNGAHAERQDIFSGKTAPLVLNPSKAGTIEHGFASVTSFFPGTKVLAAELMERVVMVATGPTDVGKATVFDDQYISTAGQFYEIIMGHDRFNADLRPLFYQILNKPIGLCCHPYDCATWLIAQEAGVLLTNGQGRPLNAPLDTHTPVTWAAYANGTLRDQIEPIIQDFLAAHGLR